MQCENKIFKNIESTCEHRVAAGIEQTVYMANRDEVTFVMAEDADGNVIPNQIAKITLNEDAKLYTAKGFKRNLTAGFTRNVSDDTVDTWTNSVSLVGYEFDAKSAMQFDNIGNIVVVVERKGTKEADGSFLVFGAENGLYVSEDSWASGEANGAREITLSSLDDAGESVSYYVYCTQSEGTNDDYFTVKKSLEDLL